MRLSIVIHVAGRILRIFGAMFLVAGRRHAVLRAASGGWRLSAGRCDHDPSRSGDGAGQSGDRRRPPTHRGSGGRGRYVARRRSLGCHPVRVGGAVTDRRPLRVDVRVYHDRCNHSRRFQPTGSGDDVLAVDDPVAGRYGRDHVVRRRAATDSLWRPAAFLRRGSRPNRRKTDAAHPPNHGVSVAPVRRFSRWPRWSRCWWRACRFTMRSVTR